MAIQETVSSFRDAMSVKRVFGEPFTKDGLTLIPAATVRGGAGGGEGTAPEGQKTGTGAGFGLVARPVGAYVIKGEDVAWRPVVDVNRIILGGQILLGLGLLTLRAFLKGRSTRKTRRHVLF